MLKLTPNWQFTIVSLIVGLANIGLPSMAQAAQLWNFQYSGNSSVPVVASGTLITSDLDPINNTYTITSITGTRTVGDVTQQIVGLLPAFEFGGSDNLLYAGEPLLSISGFSYKVEGDESVNLYSNSTLGFPGYSEQDSQGRYGIDFSFAATRVVVPEPLSVGGIVVVGAIALSMNRKRKYSI
ncbi:PEP-CTERM sorting domain-containing protein [Nostoc sp. FACHB-110]|uniref:PEP-CTERM sorting domain-containing protein n=1 Tax=Nostoc sp. FACHB-110 TaxID=2692834 RepID=UPI00168477AC|nr:PEP-CTERM sorting domain-containing protein [Nostoc sp. FACHB-110]MBD2436125.1 PEP-CTERM sorting domain-containing protein [Nostoc sp. FACHB-110]